ncbi:MULTISPECIES: queuosine precursor transporter [unclassified Helicobacter]|uniref:queuosine precursor transporter n=1 Tax=unclassified Helicobacter TaxID=2593540 RepID=UPI00267B57D9|nr:MULTISPECIES: queuosine precursor transporter [unclassified Helicobacter]
MARKLNNSTPESANKDTQIPTKAQDSANTQTFTNVQTPTGVQIPNSAQNSQLMSERVFWLCGIGFACIVVLANFSVQYPIFGTHLTFGALTYPLSFLLMNVLSEKYSKPQVLRTLRLGLVLAFVPSIFASELRIALASVCAFCVSQVLDVYVFFYLKQKFPRIWYLRNNGATMLSQLIDTMIFFHIAFFLIKPEVDIIFMILADYSMKVILALCNTPFFYALAIRGKNLLTPQSHQKEQNAYK